PVAHVYEVVPVGDLVVDRAAGVTIRDAAVHAARRLVARVLLGQRNDELAPVAHALLDRRVIAVVALELEEAGDLSHLTSSYSAQFLFGLCAVTRRPGTPDWMVKPRAAAGLRFIRPPAWQPPCLWRARRARDGTRPASPCGTWAGTAPSSPGRAWRDA